MNLLLHHLFFAVLAIPLAASAAMTFTVTVDPDTYEVSLYGQLDDTCDGLAYFSLDMTLSGPQEITLGDVLNLDAPTAMASFDRNGGVSNPSTLPGDTGYGGTADGASLRRIGGGQNTINYTGALDFPTSSVVEGIATGASPQLLATGTLDVSTFDTDEFTLELSNAYVLILDAGQAGPDYTVTRVTDITYTNGIFIPQADVSTAASVAYHGTTYGDMGIQVYPAQTIMGFPYNCESRYFTSGETHRLDIALSQAIPSDVDDITVIATDAFTFTQSATVSLNAAGDTITAVFDPLLPNNRIYTIEVSSAYITDLNFEYVIQTGNIVNFNGMNVVNTFDKSLMLTALTGSVCTAGAHYDIARVPTNNGLIDIYDKSLLLSRLGNAAARLTSAVSMANHGATEGDLGIQVWPIPAGSTIGNCEPRILTEQTLVLTFDGDVSGAAVNMTVEAEDTSSNTYTAAVARSGNTATAVFTPALPDEKIYTVTISGCATGTFEYVVLGGNCFNVGASLNTVDIYDENELSLYKNQVPSVAGPEWDVNPNGLIHDDDDGIVVGREGNYAS